MGTDKYPTSVQAALELLDQYTTNPKKKVVTSQGSSFAQGSGGNRNRQSTYDKKYWKDKECFKCGEKGHPASACNTGNPDCHQILTAMRNLPRVGRLERALLHPEPI